MNKKKYVGMDVHQASTTIVVQDASGKCLIETVMETKVETIVGFLRGLSGEVEVALEEGTQADWLYANIRPIVSKAMVCNARKTKGMGENKWDRIDAHKIADLQRAGLLKPVYHGGVGTQKLKELVHNYETVVSDNVRVMSRLKALFRGRGIACAGQRIYNPRRCDEWLEKIKEPGARSRAECLYAELAALKEVRRQAKELLITEGRKHQATKIVRSIPGIGEVRAAVIVGTVSTPHRFRTSRQFFKYCGFAVVMHSSSDYKLEGGKFIRDHRKVKTLGLNKDCNRRLKAVFKGAVPEAITKEPFKSYWNQLKARNLNPAIGRVSVARKLAAVTLAVWKNQEEFDVNRYKSSPEL